MNQELRWALQTMTEKPADTHASRLSLLKAQFSHRIKQIVSDYPLERYTCGVYAFELVNKTVYIQVATWEAGNLFAGKDFVEYLIQNHLVEISQAKATESDYAIYMEDNAFRHVGRLTLNGRVASKWGTGLLLEHPVWEVPSSYGSAVRYFGSLDMSRATAAFLDYARSRGYPF